MPGVSTMASRFLQRGAGLDHGQRDHVIVGFAQIDRLIGEAGQRHGAMRAPAALADRRIFGGCRKGARVGGVLIIGAIMPSAPKSSARLTVAKSPTGTRTIGAAPPWRTAAMPVRMRIEVPQAVLAVERHCGKAVAAERFGDERIGQAAPAGEHRFAGAQPIGESEGGNGHGAVAASAAH